MLDQVSELLDTIPKGSVEQGARRDLQGPRGSGDDLATLLESSSTVARDFDGVAEARPAHWSRTAVHCWTIRVPSADALRTWARSLAGVTGQLNANDPQFRRAVLANAPGAADETSRLLEQVKPTLPVLLANLSATVGRVAVTYHASVEQLLVLLPPYIASVQVVGLPRNNPTRGSPRATSP